MLICLLFDVDSAAPPPPPTPTSRFARGRLAAARGGSRRLAAADTRGLDWAVRGNFVTWETYLQLRKDIVPIPTLKKHVFRSFEI